MATFQNLVTEENLCELLNISKGQLNKLRTEKRFPFIAVSRRSRLYLEEDVMDWLLARRRQLNMAEGPE